MEPVSFAFAVIGTADLCIRYGKYLIDKYEDFKNAEYDVGETVLDMKSVWLKTEIQLESITDIWESLEPRLQQLFSELLDHLRGKLEVAKGGVDKIIIPDKRGAGFSVKKFRAMAYKKTILQAVEDLEKWQGRFDPSWYLITRVATLTIDHRLDDVAETKSPTGKLKQIRDAMKADPTMTKGSIFIACRLIQGEHYRLSFSTSFTTRLTNGDGDVLVDPMNFDVYSDPKDDIIHVRDLARRLSNSDPWQFGLLHCRGVIKHKDDRGTHSQLVFDIPPSLSNPRTLRDLLQHQAPHSLDQRFQLAKQLVQSLMFVHTSGFVHKSIRPDTIVVFQDRGSVIGRSFLIGFERFRPNNARSSLMGNTCWEMNIYRHPQRQGLHPEETYVMQHDIYSLGVCLLEIGFWDSFVYQEDGDTPMGPQFGSATGKTMHGKTAKSSKPGPVLETIAAELVAGKSPISIKRRLILIAHDRLPVLMGQQYADLALACLTCLDPAETNLFGQEEDLEDEDGIVVGVQYIERVCGILSALYIADGAQILLQMDDISI